MMDDGCIISKYLDIYVQFICFCLVCVVFQMFNLPDQGFQRFSNQNNKKVLLTSTSKSILTSTCEVEGELRTVGFRNDFQKKEEGFLDEYWVELCSEKLNPRDLTFFLG